MKIVLFVEGWTEKELPTFLKRWLDPRLPQPVGVKPVRFEGEGQYRQKAAKRAELYLGEGDTLAVFGLLDLYGLKLGFPPGAGRDEKIAFARHTLHREIGANHPKFRQHFAVHDVEAWLIADVAVPEGETAGEVRAARGGGFRRATVETAGAVNWEKRQGDTRGQLAATAGPGCCLREVPQL